MHSINDVILLQYRLLMKTTFHQKISSKGNDFPLSISYIYG
ncbi:hypothetical protein VCR15J2_20570 [Vibrio coralliirubri]|nr:hypothetical protein VCR15J2_20570 [Vibrio coralliirubri]